MLPDFRKDCFLPALLGLGNFQLDKIMRYYPTTWSSGSSEKFIQSLRPEDLGKLLAPARIQNKDLKEKCLSLDNEKCLQTVLQNRWGNELLTSLLYAEREYLPLFLELMLRNMDEKALVDLKAKVLHAYNQLPSYNEQKVEFLRKNAQSMKDLMAQENIKNDIVRLEKQSLDIPTNRKHFETCLLPFEKRLQLAARDINARQYNARQYND